MRHKAVFDGCRWLLILLACAGTPAYAVEWVIGAFSSMQTGAVPAGWRVLSLRDRPLTRYGLVEQDGTIVVEAQADGAAAALVCDIKLDPRAYPVLRWRWKVANLLQDSDLSRTDGDDYPARIYVTFDYNISKLPWLSRAKLRLARFLYGDDVPAAALSYVWDREAAENTVVANAYTDRVQMVVVESRPAQVGNWVSESRNVVDDYRAAFGEEPPAISGIGITTDTDDTGEFARAWYGAIVLESP